MEVVKEIGGSDISAHEIQGNTLHRQQEKKIFSPAEEAYVGMSRMNDDHNTHIDKSMLPPVYLPGQKQQPQPCPDAGSIPSTNTGIVKTQLESSISSVFKLMNDDITMSIAHWTNSFIESEKYETVFSLNQLDQLLLEAESTERDLLTQKETLRKRLVDLSNALKV